MKDSYVQFGLYHPVTSTMQKGYIDENGNMAYGEHEIVLSNEEYDPKRWEVPSLEPVQLELGIPDPEPKIANIPTKPLSEKQQWSNEQITSRGSLRLPRWAGGYRFLKNLENQFVVDVSIEERKGFIYADYYFVITGRREFVEEAMVYIEESYYAYTNRY
jgi:hypothetical protein